MKILAATLCLLTAGCTSANTAKTNMCHLSPTDFVKKMGAGWNLGNALDCIGTNETVWGNPVIKKELIDAVAARGFKTIRIPVTWRFHTGSAPDYTIEKTWMDRVEEVVNYALDDGMYVILNMHHENEWVVPQYNKVDEVTNRLNKVWTQIANRFKNNGDHLIFETLNEPRIEGSPAEWHGGTPEERDCVNKYQKACVDAIRATGGNNATRMLMIAPYGASNSPEGIKDLVVPNNDPNTIISIHNYFPAAFCLGTNATWGTQEDIAALDKSFNALSDAFISKGKAVVIGEWCANDNHNLKARLKHTKYFVREAVQRGMCPIWWDNGVRHDSGLINRKTLQWYFPQIADLIVKETKKIQHP